MLCSVGLSTSPGVTGYAGCGVDGCGLENGIDVVDGWGEDGVEG